MKIGEKIKEFRIAKGLTLADVEARAGLSDGNLSRIERGKQWLTEEKLGAIAGALGVPVYMLFISDATLNMHGSDEIKAAAKAADYPDEAAREWLSLREHLGSDDIAEFTAAIKARQKRNVKLMEELEGRQRKTQHPKSIVETADQKIGFKKHVSQSS